ncbi:hypothetical protein AK812_SmicGene36528 [Symbiodinium microadriaticum]|uniref:Uncharacterized protein n=1 Tax=Symbiodinium microadriaticum TaxID=2951 RepID=A0A1Q9CIK9_SYMMI|nr:hypothetical protein AK812_SmicGene36528 [Symbiodinium microadriaticum]
MPSLSRLPAVPLDQLHKVELQVPQRLYGEARNHRGSDQAPWTSWCPGHLQDDRGSQWKCLGAGGSRVALVPPAELGTGHHMQVLKVGTQAESLAEEKIFTLLSRDFRVVPRPGAGAPIVVELSGHAFPGQPL